MENDTVIVIGAKNNKPLLDSLFKMGLIPITRETIQGAVEKLRRTSVSAVLIDSDLADVDLLELALNVRDIDGNTPIIIIGQLPDHNLAQVIVSQPGIYLVEKHHLGRHLDELLNTFVRNEEMYA